MKTLPDEPMVEVFTRFITVKGRRIYRPDGGVFCIRIPAWKVRSR